MKAVDVQWAYDEIKDAVLEPVERGQRVQTFMLRKYPGRTMMSTMLIFAPGAIVITGDLRVDGSGMIALGYGLDWFLSNLAPRYLAEKFLKREWLSDEMWRVVYERMREARVFGDREKRRWRIGAKAIYGIEAGALLALLRQRELFASPSVLYENLPAYQGRSEFSWRCSYDGEWLGAGYNYEPHKVAWLAAIQRRFAEQYVQQGLHVRETEAVQV